MKRDLISKSIIDLGEIFNIYDITLLKEDISLKLF